MVGLAESSGGGISFAILISFHHGSPCSYITWGINNRPVCGRSSQTYSHSVIVMIVIIILLNGTRYVELRT
jgi:hypothetical protein